MSLLKIENFSKSYHTPTVLDVGFSLAEGNILCLLGPSGCGKTTLLRMIAGLTPPDSGRVLFNNKDISRVAPHKRNFGLMFQEFALFPHKNVLENVTFGPEMQGLKPSLIRERAENMLALVGMSDLAHRNVEELSGGERQRVALARCLAPNPKLLMLDEPLGSLDRNLRDKLLPEIRAILKKLAVSSIFVTHDQSEAFAVADQIAIMHQGRIEQIDPPEKLYMKPKSEFTARFLGFRNLFKAKINPHGGVETALGLFFPREPYPKDRKDGILAIRPEGAAIIESIHKAGNCPVIEGVVKNRVFSGRTFKVKIRDSGGLALTFDLPNSIPPPTSGNRILLKIDPSSMVVIIPSENRKK